MCAYSQCTVLTFFTAFRASRTSLYSMEASSWTLVPYIEFTRSYLPVQSRSDSYFVDCIPICSSSVGRHYSPWVTLLCLSITHVLTSRNCRESSQVHPWLFCSWCCSGSLYPTDWPSSEVWMLTARFSTCTCLNYAAQLTLRWSCSIVLQQNLRSTGSTNSIFEDSYSYSQVQNQCWDSTEQCKLGSQQNNKSYRMKCA
jgi:hypothetical protein